MQKLTSFLSTPSFHKLVFTFISICVTILDKNSDSYKTLQCFNNACNTMQSQNRVKSLDGNRKTKQGNISTHSESAVTPGPRHTLYPAAW